LRGQAVRNGELYLAWGSLHHTLMTGETAFDYVFKKNVWEYRKDNPELDAFFNLAFRESAARIGRELLSAYDFSNVRTVADLGGGYGALLSVILKKHPNLSGMLFDQLHVIDKAAPHLKATGIADRCRTVGGDLLTHVPEGADIYILKSVLHDWNDRQSEQILHNCRKALQKDGRLIALERIMPVRAKEDRGLVLLDLRMLTATGGRERSESEFRSLFKTAGLTVTRILPLRSGFHIIEGMPAGLSDE
jgi:SAM-dependent methyltransferase